MKGVLGEEADPPLRSVKRRVRQEHVHGAKTLAQSIDVLEEAVAGGRTPSAILSDGRNSHITRLAERGDK
jgi:hypothetical protein